MSPSGEPTPTERALAEGGVPTLAATIQDARLGLPPGLTEAERAPRLAQIGANFPLLLLAGVALLRVARRIGAERVLMSGRDCQGWQRILGWLAPRMAPGVRTPYFHSSRVARAFPSGDYLRYLDALREGRRGLIADVCGTGWSLGRLLERAGGPPTDVFLIHRIGADYSAREYDRYGTVARPPGLHWLVEGRDPAFDNESLELANAADHPMVIDMIAAGEAFTPVHAGHPPPDAVRRMVGTQLDALDLVSRMAAERIARAELDALDPPRLSGLVRLCYQHLGRYRAWMQPLADHQAAEEPDVRRLLARRSAGG